MLLHQTLSALLLAESYRNYSYLMPWLAVGYSFLIVAQFYERLCYARDKTAAVSMIETVGAIASIGLAIPLIRFFGIDGAAWAVPCYFLVQMMLARFLAKKPAIGVARSVGANVQQR
jgi:O-antigen/teichoic acid export membrane protein